MRSIKYYPKRKLMFYNSFPPSAPDESTFKWCGRNEVECRECLFHEVYDTQARLTVDKKSIMIRLAQCVNPILWRLLGKQHKDYEESVEEDTEEEEQVSDLKCFIQDSLS